MKLTLSSLSKWTPLALLILLLLLSLLLLSSHRRVGSWLASFRGTPAAGATAAWWPSAMQDVDRHLLVATPAPRQLEVIRESTFQKFYRGNPAHKEVALTFDDGPHPDSTPRLLEMLRQLHVKATFFVVGTRIETHPELLKAEAADGHCLGNHTFHHDRLTKVPNAAVPAEISDCTELIRKVTGQTTRLFRPPGGTFDRAVTDIAQSLGYQTILWTINTGDYETTDSHLIAQRALRGIENGSIILFHDRGQATVNALPEIVSTLKNQGYLFVTIEEMLAHRATAVQ